MHRVWILALASVLAACSSQDDPPDTAPVAQSTESDDARAAVPAVDAASIGTLSREELEALARDPEARREVMQDPDRRAAIRERMRELRQSRPEEGRQSASEPEGGEVRRQRRRAPWWENEAIAQDLGLTEAQTTRISEAHAELMEAARRSRQQLAQAAGDLQKALADNDRERLGELADARVAALDARARAEAAWMRRVLDILDDEQLQKLAQQHPGLISALFSPVR